VREVASGPSFERDLLGCECDLLLTIVYDEPPGVGWHPITHMATLLSELFEAELVTVSLGRLANAWVRLTSIGPRRRGRDTCLVIAGAPRNLNALLLSSYWLRGYGHVAGWVIDSFWVERIPFALRHRPHFDQLFVADKEVVDLWAGATGLPVSWLPWGSDVLRLGSANADRPIDLQRLGRQPAQWEDDTETRRWCEAAGLRFRGRPQFYDDANANQAALMRGLSQAKFSLAFSNRASPAPYTHPTREYLTGRWTDSLASGAVVAGIAPRTTGASELLWPHATLELSTTNREAGIEEIVAAVRAWSPETALDNYRRALERLDWRWRFQQLADALQLQARRLSDELAAVVEATQ
jgi:hypothetical protein